MSTRERQELQTYNNLCTFNCRRRNGVSILLIALVLLEVHAQNTKGGQPCIKSSDCESLVCITGRKDSSVTCAYPLRSRKYSESCHDDWECIENNCLEYKWTCGYRKETRNYGESCTSNSECVHYVCLSESKTCQGRRRIGESCQSSKACITEICLPDTKTCGYEDRTRETGRSCQSHRECISDNCLPVINICGIRTNNGVIPKHFYKLGCLSAGLFAIFRIFSTCTNLYVAAKRHSLITGEPVRYSGDPS